MMSETTDTGISERPRLVWLLIAVLLAVHTVLAVDTAHRMSITHDEYWHLPIGLLNWKTGRFDYDNLNPPLVRMWAAFPLLLTDAQSPLIDPPTDPTGYADRFQQKNPGRLQSMFFLGRLMIVLISVLTGLLLAVWAWKLFGAASALLTAFLWSLSPTLLANASLVTTDLGAVSFFGLTLFTLWQYARRPCWKFSLSFGLCLGLAQLVKYTCLLLYPLSVVLWFVVRVRNREVSPVPKRTAIGQWAAALFVSLFVLNAGYLFRGSFASLDSYNFSSGAMSKINRHLRLLNSVPIPFPRDYLEGLDHQRHIMEGIHPVYLDGEFSAFGYPHYYLKGLLYKLPHALHVLLLISAGSLLFRRRQPGRLRKQLLLLIPVVTLTAIASFSRMQLGIRYILPVFPFLILFAGQSAQRFAWKQHRVRTIALSAIAAGMLLPLRFHPHHLAYFNEYAGGPLGGRNHLLDSNLDWGQDLAGVKAIVDANSIDDLQLAYFGTVPPEEYGIRYRLPSSWQPVPGWHAVSVNFVQGRPHVLRDETGKIQPTGLDEFGYFRFFEPKQRIGYSIDVFHLNELDVLRWQAAMRKANPL